MRESEMLGWLPRMCWRRHICDRDHRKTNEETEAGSAKNSFCGSPWELDGFCEGSRAEKLASHILGGGPCPAILPVGPILGDLLACSCETRDWSECEAVRHVVSGARHSVQSARRAGWCMTAGRTCAPRQSRHISKHRRTRPGPVAQTVEHHSQAACLERMSSSKHCIAACCQGLWPDRKPGCGGHSRTVGTAAD